MSIIIGPPRIKNLPVDITTVTANYSATIDDYFIAVLDTTAPRTITLPLVGSVLNGRTFVIKDETGGAAVNNITVQATSPETMDGTAGKIINGNYGAITVLARTNGYSVI